MLNYKHIYLLIVLTACTTSFTFGGTYKYDVKHRLTKVVYDNGMQITYSYDEVGNRTRRVSTLQADTLVDGTVNFQDFAKMASRWLDEECGYPDEWCDGADIDWNTEVGIEDLAIIAQQWLESATQ